MRCERCGAWNPESAAWCGQCFVPTAGADTASPEPSAPDADPGGAPTSPAGAGHAPHAPPGPPGPPGPPAIALEADRDWPADARSRDVRTVDGEVEWRCGTCGAWTPLLASGCTVCGAPPQGFGQQAVPTARPVPRTAAVAATAVVPGAGHLIAGRIGTGIARALLWVVWLVAGVSLWRATADLPGAAASAPALVVLAGAAVLWAGSLVDATRLGGTGPEVLAARTLGVLVVVVTAALILTLVVASLG